MLRRLTKWSGHISQPGEAPQLVNEAFTQMRKGRPRPVALQIPVDVAAMETEITLLPPSEDVPPTQPDPELIVQAAELLAKSKNPLIIVGRNNFV